MTAVVGLIMGSTSDWETMTHAAGTLEQIGVPYEVRILSAHRTPEALRDYVASASKRGIKVIIAGAGGAAHLAGVVAAHTLMPVIGVPINSGALNGLDSLLSMVQMPAGAPVATMAIGKPGAINAALFAAAILGDGEPKYREAVKRFRDDKARETLAQPDPRGA